MPSVSATRQPTSAGMTSTLADLSGWIRSCLVGAGSPLSAAIAFPLLVSSRSSSLAECQPGTGFGVDRRGGDRGAAVVRGQGGQVELGRRLRNRVGGVHVRVKRADL